MKRSSDSRKAMPGDHRTDFLLVIIALQAVSLLSLLLQWPAYALSCETEVFLEFDLGPFWVSCGGFRTLDEYAGSESAITLTMVPSIGASLGIALTLLLTFVARRRWIKDIEITQREERDK